MEKQIEIFPSLWKQIEKFLSLWKTDGKTVAFPQWIAENVNEPQLTNVVHLTELRL